MTMMIKHLTTCTLLALALASCNQSKIDELEKEVEALRAENYALKSQLSEMEHVILQYESATQAQLNAQRQQRDFHQQNAQQHLREAEFWRQNGNEFLYENSMRNAQQELNTIP